MKSRSKGAFEIELALDDQVRFRFQQSASVADTWAAAAREIRGRSLSNGASTEVVMIPFPANPKRLSSASNAAVAPTSDDQNLRSSHTWGVPWMCFVMKLQFVSQPQ